MRPASKIWDVLLEVDFKGLESDTYRPQVRGEDVVVLAHLHCLPSIGRLFYLLLAQDLSIPPRQVMLIAKPYSTIPEAATAVEKLGVTLIQASKPFRAGYYDCAASELLKEGCKRAYHECIDIRKRSRRPRLILVDDGGMLTETWWRHYGVQKIETVSVQQTTSGIGRKPDPSELPKIDVARSAAKRHFEAKIISEGVLKKVKALDILRDTCTVGVAGVGAVGGALAQGLVAMNKQVNLYDQNAKYYRPKGSHLFTKLGCFLKESKLIFGCTGRNFLKMESFEKIRMDAHFVSCSSRDVEFLDLLRHGTIDKSSVQLPFGKIQVSAGGRRHVIENWGFPINFDRETEQEAPEEIVLTRALVLAGIFQAMCVKLDESRQDAIMLSPSIQRALVMKWLDVTGQSARNYLIGADGDIHSLEWWTCNSRGEEPSDMHKPVRAKLNEAEIAKRTSALGRSKSMASGSPGEQIKNPVQVLEFSAAKAGTGGPAPPAHHNLRRG